MVESPYLNCPTTYYLNCEKALKDCYKCAAGKGKIFNQLFYIPNLQTEELKYHPYKDDIVQHNRDKAAQKALDKKKKAESKPSSSKLGYRNEKVLVKKVNKQVNKQISVIKATVASGRINHDGDHTLLEGSIRSDSKLRTNTHAFSVSKEEYEKGLEQNINQWVITTLAGTCYVLTESLYTELIAHIIYLEGKINENRN